MNIPATRMTKGDFYATYSLSITYKENKTFYYTDHETGEIKQPTSVPRYSKKVGQEEKKVVVALTQLIKNELINQKDKLTKATLYLNLNCGGRINGILDKEKPFYYDEKFKKFIDSKNKRDENGEWKIAKFIKNAILVECFNPYMVDNVTPFLTDEILGFPQINTHNFNERDLYIYCEKLINLKVPRNQANLIYFYYKYVFLDNERHPLNNTPRKIIKPAQSEPSEEDKMLIKQFEKEEEEERQKLELQEKENQKIKANLEIIKNEKIENIKNKGLEDWQIKTILSNCKEGMAINEISIRTRIPIKKIKEVIRDNEKNNPKQTEENGNNNAILQNFKNGWGKTEKEIKPLTQIEKENILKQMQILCEMETGEERIKAVDKMEKFKKENNL